MTKMNYQNVPDTKQFSEKLQVVMQNIYELFELTKEYDLEAVNKDGGRCYYEEDGKTCFQASGQYDRPSEFLQTLLDIIRVNFEPCVLGTLFLNSNMCFLYDAIPESSIQLAYASLTSDNNKQFKEFWNEDFVPYLEDCGYVIEDATAIYAVASTGGERYGIDFVDDIVTTLNSGFTVDEAIDLLAASICEYTNQPRKRVYSGYCLDSALERKIRLSLWMFIRKTGYPLPSPRYKM